MKKKYKWEVTYGEVLLPERRKMKSIKQKEQEDQALHPENWEYNERLNYLVPKVG